MIRRIHSDLCRRQNHKPGTVVKTPSVSMAEMMSVAARPSRHIPGQHELHLPFFPGTKRQTSFHFAPRRSRLVQDTEPGFAASGARAHSNCPRPTPPKSPATRESGFGCRAHFASASLGPGNMQATIRPGIRRTDSGCRRRGRKREYWNRSHHREEKAPRRASPRLPAHQVHTPVRRQDSGPNSGSAGMDSLFRWRRSAGWSGRQVQFQQGGMQVSGWREAVEDRTQPESSIAVEVDAAGSNSSKRHAPRASPRRNTTPQTACLKPWTVNSAIAYGANGSETSCDGVPKPGVADARAGGFAPSTRL